MGDLWSLVRRLSPCFSPCCLCLVHDPYLFPTHCLMSLVLFQVMFHRFLLAPMSSMLWPSSGSCDILAETYVPFTLLLLWYLGRTPHVHNLRIRFYLVAPILPERLNAWVSIPDHCDLSILVHSFVPLHPRFPFTFWTTEQQQTPLAFIPKLCSGLPMPPDVLPTLFQAPGLSASCPIRRATFPACPHAFPSFPEPFR